MGEHHWFVLDEDDGVELTEAQRAFARLLHEHAQAWGPPDIGSEVFFNDESGCLVAMLSVDDPQANLILMHLGVHFLDDHVRGDRLHSQLQTLPERPSRWALHATGPMEELARASADWLRAVSRKPIVLYVWLRRRRAYATRYAFADSGETIVQSYDRRRAPWGQHRALVRSGHVVDLGWIQTDGLPRPDYYVHIHGDLDPSMVSAEIPRSTESGRIDTGVCYE